jgi:hypothetical protein
MTKSQTVIIHTKTLPKSSPFLQHYTYTILNSFNNVSKNEYLQKIPLILSLVIIPHKTTI